jgi:hypothetical protein
VIIGTHLDTSHCCGLWWAAFAKQICWKATGLGLC